MTYVGEYYDSEIIDELESNDNDAVKEDTPLLDLALKVCSEKELVVLLPHIIDGIQLVDIAKANNLPEGTVRWRYNTALNKIRKVLGRSKMDEK